MSQNPEFKAEPVSTVPAENTIAEPAVEILKEAPEIQPTEMGTGQTPPPAKPADDQTNQQVQPVVPTSTVTITIPATAQQLEDWAKGSPDDSLTWVAYFWVRMIKKAIFHGWNIVSGGNALTSA